VAEIKTGVVHAVRGGYKTQAALVWFKLSNQILSYVKFVFVFLTGQNISALKILFMIQDKLKVSISVV